MSLYPVTDRQKGLAEGRLMMLSRCFEIVLDVPGREPIRLTDHNRALSYLGEWWFPANPDDPVDKVGGIRGRDADRREGLNESVSQIQGILSSSQISIDDIAAGFYRGAHVTEYWVDRRDIFASSFKDYRSAKKWRIAEISRTTDDTYSIELVSMSTYHLHRRRGETTSRVCRYRLFSTSQDTGGLCNIYKGNDGAGSPPPLFQPEWQIGHEDDYCLVTSLQDRRTIQINVPLLTVSNLTATNPAFMAFTTPHRFWGAQWHANLVDRELRFNILIGGLPGQDGVNLNGYHAASLVKAENEFAIEIAIDNSTGTGAFTGGFAELSPVDNQFADGTLQFLDPALPSYSASYDIESSTSAGADILLTLHDSIRFEEAELGACQLTAGCDGSASTCFSTFDNIVNFGGEATIPGSSRVISTPDSPS